VNAASRRIVMRRKQAWGWISGVELDAPGYGEAEEATTRSTNLQLYFIGFLPYIYGSTEV
jgi:hypothetical protein